MPLESTLSLYTSFQKSLLKLDCSDVGTLKCVVLNIPPGLLPDTVPFKQRSIFIFLGSFLPSVKNNKPSNTSIAVIIPVGVGVSIESPLASVYVASVPEVKFNIFGFVKTKTTPALN